MPVKLIRIMPIRIMTIPDQVGEDKTASPDQVGEDKMA